MLSKQILGCLFGAMFTMTSLPTHLLANPIAEKNNRHHSSSSSSSSSSVSYESIGSSSSSCSKKKKHHSSYKSNEFDYIIVGNGTAGAVLARKLTNNKKNRVLVLEAGPNLSKDPQVLNPVVFTNLYDLTFNPKFVETYPNPLPFSAGLLQTVTYSEARMWGGGSAHNYLLAVHGTPDLYNSWAAVSGNPRWTYNNLLPTIRAVETYTPNGTVANPIERGSHGPIFVTQRAPINTSPLAIAMSSVTNAPQVTDYNDPTLGNTGVSSYQEFITPPPNSQRSFSISGYLPDSVVTPEGKGLHGRRLRISSDTTVNRILFKDKRAIGVECVLNGTVEKVKRAYAKKKVIVCAGGIHTPSLLQRSGIGDATLLNSLDIPVIVNNPNVGANLSNQYGAVTVLSGTEPENIQANINCSPYYPNDDVRRIQYLTNPGVGAILGYGFITTPQSRGFVSIVSKNPFIHPKVDLNMYSDGPVNVPGTDAYTIVSYLKILQAIATAEGESVFLPTPDDYTNDDTLLAFAMGTPNIIITSHITGTCRMATSAADGVVDGNLNVFGVDDLMVVDLSVAPVQPDGNTCYPVYVIANEAAHILGVH